MFFRSDQSTIFPRYRLRMSIVPENDYIKESQMMIEKDNALMNNLERKIVFPANERSAEKCKSDPICLLLSHVCVRERCFFFLRSVCFFLFSSLPSTPTLSLRRTLFLRRLIVI